MCGHFESSCVRNRWWIADNDDKKKMYNDLLKKEQKEIAQGYNRIFAKVKILRQGFSTAVVAV